MSFASDSLALRARLTPETQLECKICCWLYSPQSGDPEAEIPPGVAFTALPEHWRCPVCDAAADQFTVVP